MMRLRNVEESKWYIRTVTGDSIVSAYPGWDERRENIDSDLTNSDRLETIY